MTLLHRLTCGLMVSLTATTVAARVHAPPHTKIAWFTAEGSFRTYQREAASKTRNTIAFATGTPQDFHEIYRADMPTDMGHWHYNAAREVQLQRPAEKIFVRYDGDPALNNFRIYAHCVEETPRPSSPVVVTHVWTDMEGRKTRQVELEGPGEYEIEAGAEPVDESIAIAVLSDGPVDAGHEAVRRRGTQALDWVTPMRKVHARFSGKPGTFAQFGDSITDSRAFWFSLKWKRANATDAMRADFQLVRDHMLDDCWDRKGAKYGNQGGQTIHWAAKHVDTWLRQWNPEAAILMFGTNDLNNVAVADYEATLEDVVQRCLDNGTVVILSTIPPRHGREEKAAKFAAAARRVATRRHVPLTDFHAEILRRRPDDWDGALEKFRDYHGYDVPTLIARDGVHPSNPTRYQADYSNAALANSGFSLRNFMVLRMYAEVIRNVICPK
jgi:lysophospholipase L1-like esterase